MLAARRCFAGALVLGITSPARSEPSPRAEPPSGAASQSASSALAPGTSSEPRAAVQQQASSSTEHQVEFRAQRVELSSDPGTITLSGDVVVRAERFRLTGERLELSRSRRGLHAEGAGRLALCPCPRPVATFGFSSADLAPPTDALLKNATLRLGPVPLFWWPYLWLRSPERSGLLPPTIAYRGEEGLSIGSGAHVPFRTEEGSDGSLDVSAAAYVRGGVRAESRFRAASGRTVLVLDDFRGGLSLGIDSAHATAQQQTTFSEEVDWLRGGRSRVAPAEIEEVALPRDRAHLGLLRAESSVFGAALESDARRGGALDAMGVAGPSLFFGTGASVGRAARFGAAGSVRSATTPAGALLIASADARLSSTAFLGPARSTTELAHRADLATLPDTRAASLRSELRSRLGVPLIRRYARVTHTIEPFVEGALGLASLSESHTPELLADIALPTRRVVLLSGAETALGSLTTRSASDLLVVAGYLGAPRQLEKVLAARVRVDTGIVRFASEARAMPRVSALAVAVRAAAGHIDGFRLRVHVDATHGDAAATWGLLSEDFTIPASAPLASAGVSAGARVGIPWFSGISTELGAEADVSAKRWLSSLAEIAYRHPCRCLSFAVAGSRRMGREGFDLAFNFQLVPR